MSTYDDWKTTDPSDADYCENGHYHCSVRCCVGERDGGDHCAESCDHGREDEELEPASATPGWGK